MLFLPFALFALAADTDADWLVTRSQVKSTVTHNSTAHTITIANGLLERCIYIYIYIYCWNGIYIIYIYMSFGAIRFRG